MYQLQLLNFFTNIGFFRVYASNNGDLSPSSSTDGLFAILCQLGKYNVFYINIVHHYSNQRVRRSAYHTVNWSSMQCINYLLNTVVVTWEDLEEDCSCNTPHKWPTWTCQNFDPIKAQNMYSFDLTKCHQSCFMILLWKWRHFMQPNVFSNISNMSNISHLVWPFWEMWV